MARIVSRPTAARTRGPAQAAYFEALLSQSGAVACVRDRDGRYLVANAGYERMTGRAAAAILGATVYDVLPAQAAIHEAAHDRTVLTLGRATKTYEAVPHPDGTVHHYVTERFPLFDGCPEPYAVGSFATDVTEIASTQRAHQAAQVEAETLFRGVFDHAPIGQIFSALDGTITAVNRPMAAMLGYRPEEMIGRGTSAFADPTEYARISDDAQALLNRTALSVSAIRYFRHRDGHDVPVRVTSALLRNEDDLPRWWVSIVADISEEERARAELEQAHRETLVAAERLQLLNSIAIAANDSADIAAVAPATLAAVCEHFGWPAAALIDWTPTADAAGPSYELLATWADEHRTDAGELEVAQWTSQALRRLVPQTRLDSGVTAIGVPMLGADGIATVVAVPPNSGDHPRFFWLFFSEQHMLHAEECELLSLIGIATSRVVERQAAQLRLLNSEEQFRSVFAGSPLPMALTLGSSGTFSAVNDALCLLLGRSTDELIGRPVTDFTHPEDVGLTDPAGAAAAAAPDGIHCFELRLLHASGAVVIAAVTLTWMYASDGSRNLLAQIEDVTERRRAEELLRHQAERDSLTGLGNRAHLGALLRDGAVEAAHCAVLFIDLDGFKAINDNLGHDIGDQVLVEVANRLRASVRPWDEIARFGGDEFVVLCGAGVDEPTASQIATRIEAALSVPVLTEVGPVDITASVGVATGTLAAANPNELLQRADVAMYQAKRLGKDRVEIYDAKLHQAALTRQRIEAALRNALAEKRFMVHYQPIVALSDQQIVGFEALVRLQDEHGQLLSPDAFIEVAEQTGLIVPMGAWVLTEACTTIARLRARTGRELTISVNVAARQAARPDLVETVVAALQQSGLAENALALELTESALLEAEDATLSQLEALRARSVRISLDDFGTGYSSLSYLRRFPVTSLKVDRSFVAGIAASADDLAIVRSISRLAHDLGLSCVAEGVETIEQRDLLRYLGVQYAQGYLFSRPVPAERLAELMASPPWLD